MNRAERRREERLGISKESIMQRYGKEAYDSGYAQGARSVIEITFYMVAYTLSYKTGYSKTRIREIVNSIYDNIDAYRTGHLNPEDYDEIVRMMNEDYHIKLT